jgi:hypothetical protein
MYCFQDRSEVISIKREATDTQQDQQNCAVALSFPAMEVEEEVSCIFYIHRYSYFQTRWFVRKLFFCFIHISVHNTYIYTCFRQVSQPQKPSMFCPSLPLSCFHTTWWFALLTEQFPFHILCLYSLCIPRMCKFVPCNFNSTCLCSNTQLWPLLEVCSGKNDGSEDICCCVKISWKVPFEWNFISWDNLGTCSPNFHDPQPTVVCASQCKFRLSFIMFG